MSEKIYTLGISAYYHDSAAALLCDGHIVAAAHEERFTRKKHDPDFPEKAVRYVLQEAGISLHEVNAIAFYDKPFLKFERLLETYHAFAPRGLRSFFVSMPVWIKEKLFMRTMLERGFAPFLAPKQKLPEIVFPEHHLSHAASAFYPSPYEDAAILTIDGVGEWVTTSICKGQGNSITTQREIHFPHSLGLLYSAFTAYCGFKVNSGEYKLMGLAPYGSVKSARTAEFEQKIRENLIDIREDGSYVLNMKYFSYATGFRMYTAEPWTTLFGIPPRTAESEELEQEYMDLALAMQHVTEDVVLRLARTARDLTGSKNICLAGGVALNCVANGKLLDSGIFEKMWIQPASGDAGGALGAALAHWHISLEKERTLPATRDWMQGSYLGPAFDGGEITRACKRFKGVAKKHENFSELCAEVTDLLADGKVVGWFQGRMEYGPRALGNRSILGDPRNPEMQKRLNLKIKYREGFRPFAPSVLEEHMHEYFDIKDISPYMLLVVPVSEHLWHPLPENYDSLPLWERLYWQRSDLPAITHIDLSARVQSVSKDTNPRYWELINTFNERHGCPVVVNTSFNVRGEPVVCTPEDAYLCFMRTEMDYLVLGDYILCKEDQPGLGDDEDWRSLYVLD